jgi:hypothetical protein
LQKSLAQAAVRARSFDKELNSAKSRTKEKRSSAQASGDREQLARLGSEESELELAREANRRSRYALRVVQDGVIWRLLSFDRHLLTVLGHGEPVNYPSASFRDECEAAEGEWADGRLAVLADLSNILRTGDLLILNPDRNEIILAEVTSSSGNGRKMRQLSRIGGQD